MSDKVAMAGIAAGAAETLATQPFDMIKTRFQLNPGTNPSMLRMMQSLVAEGGVGRLYRGLLPELSGNVPTRTAMFMGRDFASKQLVGPNGQRSARTEFLAGGFAGVPEAMAATPFQVVKVRLQNPANNHLYTNTIQCFTHVARTEGPMAFTVGFPSTAARNGVWNSVFFCTMFTVRDSLPEEKGLMGKLTAFVASFCAGVMATGCNAPFDVAKSRIQGDSGEVRKYTGTVQTLSLVLKNEGPFALYKGCGAYAMRMGLGAAVQILTFEGVCSLL